MNPASPDMMLQIAHRKTLDDIERASRRRLARSARRSPRTNRASGRPAGAARRREVLWRRVQRPA